MFLSPITWKCASQHRNASLVHAPVYKSDIAPPRETNTTPEWQAAIEALILVAELDGPTMFARIGMMRALNRHVELVF